MEAGGPGRKARPAINVTPLIDIVLVLLIGFIVMLPRLTRALAVTVPRVAAAPVPPAPSGPPVVITLSRPAGGAWEYRLQGAPVRPPELAERLLPAVLRQAPGLRRVTLRIDGEAPYQLAVDVLDQVRLASDRARQASRDQGGPDGGEVKVAIALR
jgi:biopolymer transport protein ExbD